MEVLFLVAGILIGIFLGVISLKKEPIGTLKISELDDDMNQYLFLEIDHGKAYLLQQRKHITLRVDFSHN